MRNMCYNKQKNTQKKCQMKQVGSGKLIIHEMKSIISILYTNLLFWQSISSKKGSFNSEKYHSK